MCVLWIFDITFIYIYSTYAVCPIVKSECGWTYFTLLEIENQLPHVRFFVSLSLSLTVALTVVLDVSSGFISIFLSFRAIFLWHFLNTNAQTKGRKNEKSNVMKPLWNTDRWNREFHMQFDQNVRTEQKFDAWKCEVRIGLIHVISNEFLFVSGLDVKKNVSHFIIG